MSLLSTGWDGQVQDEGSTKVGTVVYVVLVAPSLDIEVWRLYHFISSLK